MEDEIDLNVYVRTLFRHWRFIAAVTLLAGVIALAVTSVAPVTYQANAMVLITRALYQIQFSPEIPNLSDATNLQQLVTGRAATDLATSDAVLQQVLFEVRDDLTVDERNLTALRKMLAAETGGNPSIVNLSAKARSAQQAADIANTWARVYVQQVNEIYLQPADQLQFFEGQLGQARDDLERADQALTEFQKRNDFHILGAQLDAKQAALSDYLTMNESLVMLQQNVQDLRDQLASRPPDSSSSLGDSLAQLMLQITAFGAQSSDLPILLQMPGTGNLSDQTVGEQADYLAELAKTVESRQAEVRKQADALPAEIRELQGQIQEISMEATRLTRQRDLGETVYTTLAQKVRETEISAQDTSRLVRLASNAAVPETPMSRGRLLNMALGLLVGLMASIMVVFALEYLQDQKKVSDDLRQERELIAGQ